MEVTTWTKRSQGRCQAAIRKGEVIGPRNNLIGYGCWFYDSMQRKREYRYWEGTHTYLGVEERGAASKANK